MMEFEELVKDVLKQEGGYVNRVEDRGGPTNMGITQRVYSDWLASKGRSWTSVKNLTRDEAETIYLELYWRNAKCGLIPTTVRDIHFDSAVNHGVTRAAKFLQQAAGATVDGIIGLKTIRRASEVMPELLRMRYIVLRYRFYGEILARDRTQLAFITGWLKRMAQFS